MEWVSGNFVNVILTGLENIFNIGFHTFYLTMGTYYL